MTRVHPNQNWESSWFSVQNSWNDELQQDDCFLKLVDSCRRHSMPPNGSVRKEVLPLLQTYNSKAMSVAQRPSPPTDDLDALRKQVLRLPFENDTANAGMHTGIAVYQGILYIFGPRGALLRQQRVLLDLTSGRPDPLVVLSALYQTLCQQKCRPPMIHLGQPSICSHQDVEVYEHALDESILCGNCTLGLLGSVEDAVKRLLPAWRSMGIPLLCMND